MRHHLLPASLLLVVLLSPELAEAKKKAKRGSAASATEKSDARPFTQKHPYQPFHQQVKEEDIPAGTPIKKIREGEVLDLSENARKESEREQPKEVHHMFDAVMTDDFAHVSQLVSTR